MAGQIAAAQAEASRGDRIQAVAELVRLFFEMGQAATKLSWIDDGFFVAGVAALKDINRLHEFGIKYVLNVGTAQLYQQKGQVTMEALQPFEVKIMELEDRETQDCSPHFGEMADFIEEGRRAGGIVVHCAAGISRAPTACIAYLMLRRHLSLKAAFARVQRNRIIIHPNTGFWQQLRALEAELWEDVELRTLEAELPELPPLGLANQRQLWEVVGGADSGGLLVRRGEEVGSEKLVERLATGSLVREQLLKGDRLRFSLLTGYGPAAGWITTRLRDRQLARPVDPEEGLPRGVMRQLDLEVAHRVDAGLFLVIRVVLTLWVSPHSIQYEDGIAYCTICRTRSKSSNPTKANMDRPCVPFVPSLDHDLPGSEHVYTQVATTRKICACAKCM